MILLIARKSLTRTYQSWAAPRPDITMLGAKCAQTGRICQMYKCFMPAKRTDHAPRARTTIVLDFGTAASVAMGSIETRA